MTLYVDSSALLKRYVDEHDSELADELLRSDPVILTSRLCRRRATTVLTFDARQARAAREIGLAVIGA